MSVPVFYWIRYVLMPIAGGILAASGFIIAKNPNAKQLIDKIAPYKGTIGAVMLGLGIWNLVSNLSNMGDMFTSLWGLTVLLVIIAEIVVGFLLGFGMVAKYAGSHAEKGEAMQKKLIAFEVPIGFIAIVSGLMMTLFFLGILKP